MISTLDIGPTPGEESCEQLGPNYRPDRAKVECRIFIQQLKRQFGEPPDGAQFKITSNLHDFGTYYDVAIAYDPENQAASDYAWRVERETPGYWDELSRSQIDVLYNPPAPMTFGAVLKHKYN